MLRIIDHKIEFLSILGWMLFYPFKESLFYFLGSAVLICFFSIRNIYNLKNISLSTFSSIVMGVDVIFILLTFFSICYINSILFLSDILLISFYFILFYNERRSEKSFLRQLLYIVSVFSLVSIIRYVIPLFEPGRPFFISTIHEGVIAGIGVLLSLYYVLDSSPVNTTDETGHMKRWYSILLILNIVGVFLSRSKAAFIGIILFSLLLIVAALFTRLPQKKRFLFVAIVLGIFTIFVTLTFLIPNPIKSSFHYSLKKDPYAANRLDIWKMSLTIFKDHIGVGVGLNNFADVCGKYNFKQTRGPANYFKLPSNTHNDYLQLMTETGIFGLILILALFFFLVKKIVSSRLFDISKVLLLFLLFQAFFFNVLFNGFSIFLFLFLLKNSFEEGVTFKSFSLRLKLFLSFMLAFVFIIGYLFPWISGELIDKSKKSTHPVRVYSLLQKAERLDPLNYKIHYLKAFSLYNYFRQSSNLDAFYEAISQLKKAQGLNRYFIDAYRLESNLYLELLKKNVQYVSMDDEIIAPLEKAEYYAPFDPFIKLTKAGVYFKFNKIERAKEEAVKALALEPEYVSALYFLQLNFNYIGDEKSFKEKIDKIQKKARELNPDPGRYLYRLYEIPGK